MTIIRPTTGAASPATGDAVTLADCSELILRRCGIAVRDAQMPILTELVESKARAHGLADLRAYYELLDAEPLGGSEWTEVIARLVSHETSFFRHPPSFAALQSHILPDLRSRPHVGANALSLWSAGCSTGQEAYSLAMAAMAERADAPEFTVWGTDISRAAIDTARRGRYAIKAIAGLPQPYRWAFLRPIGAGAHAEYEVVDEVRAHVRFVAADLYTACGIGLTHDVIFCHNVLIYFAPAAARQLLSMLGARLTPGGYLLVGPGEATGACPPGLEPVTLGALRALRRVGRVVSEGRP